MNKMIVLPFFIMTSLLVMPLLGGEVSPFVDLSFDNALKLAVERDKIVMVKFHADWCHWCQLKWTWMTDKGSIWLNGLAFQLSPRLFFLIPEAMSLGNTKAIKRPGRWGTFSRGTGSQKR